MSVMKFAHFGCNLQFPFSFQVNHITMDVLQDFLNTYTPTEVGGVEIVKVKEEPVIQKPDEVKVEVHVKIEPVQVDLPETAKQPPAPPNDSTTVVLEDVGRLTEVGKVPIIDDEHMVNLAN